MNTLTDILSIQFPIVQGPFGGGLSSIELVKTVADLGGLGSFGAHHLAPQEITALIEAIKSATHGKFAINLWVSNNDYFIDSIDGDRYEKFVELFNPVYERLGISPPPHKEIFEDLYESQLQVTIDAGPPAISFVYGVPSLAVIKECTAKGIVTIGTATTLDEALELDRAGINVIVASGFEAGGHRVSYLKKAEDCLTGSISLIPQIVDNVRAPVIAAGGIADARGVRAAMALGAQGVQVGTAFLACRESAANAMHKNALLSDQASRTVLSRAFTGRLARFIDNDFIRYVEKTTELPLPYPLQSYFTNNIKDAAAAQADAAHASLYAGQSASLLRHSCAQDLMNSLIVDFV